MTTVIIAARERTEYWRPYSPTSAAIDAAFRRVDLGSWGRWIGNGPRIVRLVYDFTNAAENRYGIYTYAVQPFELAPAMDAHATYVLQRVLAALDDQLRAIQNSEWEPAQLALYAETRNGPLTFWSSGRARQTVTRDLQEQAFASFRANNRENPVGPNDLAAASGSNPSPTNPGAPGPDIATPTPAPPALPDRVRETATSWTPWLVLGGLALFALYALPALGTANRVRQALPNPARPRRRRVRNPRPAVWSVAPAGTPYECKSPYIGATVPGRGGGVVRSCATPSKARPREGQFYLVDPRGTLPGYGERMPKSRATRRVREAKRPKARAMPLEYLHEAHEGYRATGIPRPSGLEFPHAAGASPCDPEARVWSGFAEALEDAEERAAIQAEDGDERDYERALRAALKRDPRFAEWDAAAASCAAGFDDRQRAKKPKAQSAATERGALRRELREVGEDVFKARHGGELSEVLDTLTEGHKRKRAAKVGAPRRRKAA